MLCKCKTLKLPLRKKPTVWQSTSRLDKSETEQLTCMLTRQSTHFTDYILKLPGNPSYFFTKQLSCFSEPLSATTEINVK